MARVYFTYTRKYLGVETGTVSVDIDDPHDVPEMKRKLEAGEYTSMLPSSRDETNESWHFEIERMN